MKFTHKNWHLTKTTIVHSDCPDTSKLLISAMKEGMYDYAYLLTQALPDINILDEKGESALILMLKSRMSYFKTMQKGVDAPHNKETIKLMDQMIHLMFTKNANTELTDIEGRSVLDLIIANEANEYIFTSAIKEKIHLPDDAVEKLIAGQLISEGARTFMSPQFELALKELDTNGLLHANHPAPAAAAFGNERFLKLLLEKNNTSEVENNPYLYAQHQTSLFQAIWKTQWVCAEILICFGHEYIDDPDGSTIYFLSEQKCTNMTLINYCVLNLLDSGEDLADTGFKDLVSMLKEANVDISREDALGNTLLMATLDCGREGSEKHELLAILLEKFPELIPQAIETLMGDHDGLQFLFESELGEAVDYAGPLYEFIIENKIVLDFDSEELVAGTVDAYASSLLSADANNML